MTRAGVIRAIALLSGIVTVPGVGPVAWARVVATTSMGFGVEHHVAIDAPPAMVWDALLHPSRWWASAHTFSGDSGNLSLDAVPGGCFCEQLPGGGGVEHGRIVYVAPEKQLRLQAALGPLQAAAVTGTLTYTMSATRDGGTMLTMRYAVAGDLPGGAAAIAPAVDGVLGLLVGNLKAAADSVAPDE